MDNCRPTVWDFGVGWEWKYDDEFVSRLSHAMQSRGLACFVVHPGNLDETLHHMDEGMHFSSWLDRAGDVDRRFLKIEKLVHERGGRVVNRSSASLWATDKATMHLEFLSRGLDVPYTLILPPFRDQPALPPLSLDILGAPFIIKPASFGGGVGVETGSSLDDLVRARKQYPEQKYLVQEKVEPATFGANRAWFRPVYVCGDVFLTWWDDRTHVYEEVTAADVVSFNLGPVKDIMVAIGQVSGLQFFTAEICFTTSSRWVVVDYVNEPCDMRVKSIHGDGVPDSVVSRVVERLAEAAALAKGGGS